VKPQLGYERLRGKNEKVNCKKERINYKGQGLRRTGEKKRVEPQSREGHRVSSQNFGEIAGKTARALLEAEENHKAGADRVHNTRIRQERL